MWTDEDRHRQTGGQAVVPVRPASDEAPPRPCWLAGVALPGLAVALRRPLGLFLPHARPGAGDAWGPGVLCAASRTCRHCPSREQGRGWQMRKGN